MAARTQHILLPLAASKSWTKLSQDGAGNLNLLIGKRPRTVISLRWRCGVILCLEGLGVRRVLVSGSRSPVALHAKGCTNILCFPCLLGIVGVAVALEAERAGEVSEMFNLAAAALTDFEDRAVGELYRGFVTVV